MRIERDGLLLSDDKSLLDVARIHRWLTNSYWANGIPVETVRASIAGSDCFGVHERGEQLAFARLITDRATFAYLCDVYVDETQRGRGIGSWLIETIQAQAEYQGLRRWMLATRDAHSLYEQHGWTRVTDPAPLMQRHDPDVYTRARDE